MVNMWESIKNNLSSFRTHSSNVVLRSTTGGGRFNRLASRLHFLRQQGKIGLRDTKSRFKAYTSALAVFTLAFAMSFLAASTLSTPNNTSAEGNEDTSTTTAGDYSLSVSATKGVNLSLSVGDSDTMTVSEGFVSVKTNSPGYKLYISMTGDSTNLTNVKDHLSSAIVATSGTIGDPAALTRGTWGYAIPSGTAHLVSDSKFSDSYSIATSTSPDDSKKFATPPSGNSNPSLLATSVSSTSESGDSYPVFYAIRANANTAPGEYSNSIAYTAVADAGSVDKVTISPDSANVNTAVNMTVNTTLYTTASSADADVYLLTATEYNSIEGTNVEALGKTPLSCTKSTSAPLGYTCSFTAPSTQATYYIYVKAPKYNKVYTTTFNTHNPVTLTVNPNGGTWESSTSAQNFTQNEGTQKTINNPSANATYTITYNANNTGATGFPASATVSRSFTGWTTSGGGSISGTTYTFGATNGTLTAGYNSTSDSFTLPAVNKAGHTCKWAEGSTSGTQYNAGTSRTTTGNRTYYAICTANNYTVNITNSNTTSGATSLSIPYGGSKTVTVTPAAGYYLSAISCPSGYTCSGHTGSSYTSQQTVTVTNNNTTAGGTLAFTGTALNLAQKCNNATPETRFMHSGVEYIKLKTASSSTSGVDGYICYEYALKLGAVNQHQSLCQSDGALPVSYSDFQKTVRGTGSAQLRSLTGWNGQVLSAEYRTASTGAFSSGYLTCTEAKGCGATTTTQRVASGAGSGVTWYTLQYTCKVNPAP